MIRHRIEPTLCDADNWDLAQTTAHAEWTDLDLLLHNEARAEGGGQTGHVSELGRAFHGRVTPTETRSTFSRSTPSGRPRSGHPPREPIP
jgi:hypothetical protein